MSKKYLDTRDLYKRKCELEDLKNNIESCEEYLKEAEGVAAALEETPDDEATETSRELAAEAVEDAQSALDSALEDFGDDEKSELAELEELESEISEFRHGETMVPESEFEDYACELAYDLGVMPKDRPWPLNCIDWKEASDELKSDYSELTYQGEMYLVRSC